MSSGSVLVMPWWKSNISADNLISSSPSSASSSSSATSSAPRKGRLKDLSFFPWIRRDEHPRLTRQRKLRHLTDLEIEALSLEDPSFAFSSSTPVSRAGSKGDAFPSRSASSPMLLPRPLPLPAVLVHRDSASDRGLGSSSVISVGHPLPSPLETLGRAEGDQGNGTVAEPLALESVAGRQHVDKPSNQTTISYRRKVLQDPNSSGTMNFKLKIPANTVAIGDFSSPIATPVLSPRRLSSADYLVSGNGSTVTVSAPEVSTMGLVTVSSSQTSPDKMIHSPENFPFSTPNIQSNTSKSRNPSGPSSPLHTKKFPENSNTRYDGGGNVEVHPLPLPPGASPASQPTFSHQSAAKAELSHKTNQWQKGKLLGSGTFGNVYEATNRHTGALCAMKEVNIIPDDPKSAECLKQLEQEIKFLSQFKHPNIVQYYGTETIKDHLYIYLEYVHPGSINKYVRQYCGAMTESVVQNFTRHILNGLIYLHSKNIMHRDIKGANLLVDVNGVVKLADFGMAKHLSGAAPTCSLKGSPFWIAPEMLQATFNKEIGYDLAVDIWSLGCTIIEMFTGKHPWSDLEGPQAMFKVLCKDPPIPETLSSEGKDFLQRCFHRNPAERPTANMLLDHPFLRNANHYNIHGSPQTFAGIKLANSISSKDQSKSKSEPCMKRKHVSNSENNHSHPEFPQLAASLLSTHSAAKVFPSLSPPRSSYIVPVQSVSSANSQIEVQFNAGNFQSHALPKPYGKEDNNQV
ncbi:mitogen-activated protein kinase kinase kinase 5-like isoform X2 [Zingiber officinale]|uniref:mitogen-activated protein kinase kinase kinase 5-like isoform X2 n=1 Tax=Zingiber officinale TaxID=94328 RepID=UPI001C4D861D|nr:mitogen-activated protein kinase kinase kinase 5-like isoform X2 [Zingiber officinale]